MTDIPEGAERSEDGQWWWDGTQWQPVGDMSSESSDASYESVADQSTQAKTNQINAEEFPAIARALYYGADPDAYLQDLGIDPSGLQSDEPAVS